MPYDLDGWDGYPAARARMDVIFQGAAGGEAIVVSGDSHAFWVNQLHDAAGDKRVALEFGTSAITSPSIGDGAGGFQLCPVFMHQYPEVSFCDQLASGYVRLTLRPDQALGDLVRVQIDAKPYAATSWPPGACGPPPNRGGSGRARLRSRARAGARAQMAAKPGSRPRPMSGVG